MERYQKTKNKPQIRFINPTNDEICRVIEEQGKNPYIELQQRLLDEEGKELGTTTIVPYLMTKYGLSDGLIQFVDSFQRHSYEAKTELVMQMQTKK